MNATIKIGDVVELNSGGPKMTIVNLYPSDCLVAWMNKDINGNFKPESAKFPLAAVKLSANS